MLNTARINTSKQATNPEHGLIITCPAASYPIDSNHSIWIPAKKLFQQFVKQRLRQHPNCWICLDSEAMTTTRPHGFE
eukprot:5089257-Amphidinium_carterae.1